MTCRSQWGRSHSAYISEQVTVHYRWSDLFGSTLETLRVIRRNEGEWLICEAPTGNAVAIPTWMADRAICSAFTFGPPWLRPPLFGNSACSLTLYNLVHFAVRHPGVLPQWGVRMKQNKTTKQIALLLEPELTGDTVLSELPMARTAELIKVLSDLLLSAARGDANLQGGNDGVA